MSAGGKSARSGLLLMPGEIRSCPAAGSEGGESVGRTDLISSSPSLGAAELPLSVKC